MTNDRTCRRSRARFPAIFSFQYRDCDFTLRVPSTQRLQPCQKQPWTNTHAPIAGNTRSGLPGRSRRCSRYRRPSRCRNRLTSSSGEVSWLRIRRIFSLRRSGVSVSTAPVYGSRRGESVFRSSASLMHACCRPTRARCERISQRPTPRDRSPQFVKHFRRSSIQPLTVGAWRVSKSGTERAEKSRQEPTPPNQELLNLHAPLILDARIGELRASSSREGIRPAAPNPTG